MSSRPELRLDWCSYEAAKYAVEHWHYSRTMPVGKMVKIGVWEDGRYIGAVIFGLGAGNATDGRRFGLAKNFQVAELVRVALSSHATPVSRIVAIALRYVSRANPGLRLIVSYADPRQGHHGGIYKAGGWTYVGETPGCRLYVDRTGREHHERTVSESQAKSHFGRLSPCMKKSDAVRVIDQPGKHIYLMPLDDEMRARIAPLAKPYPRASRLESEAPGVQPGSEGAAMRPTRSNIVKVPDGQTDEALA